MYPQTALQFGMSGPEVTQLQQFLISQGMSIPSGPTGYFGNETKAALTSWQQKTGVQAGADFGYWGPKSIAVAKTVSAPQQTVQQPVQQPIQQSITTPQPVLTPTQQTQYFSQTSSMANPPSPTTWAAQQPAQQPVQPPTQTSTTSQFPTTALTPGMESPEVKKLQEYLVKNGYMTPEEMATGPGIYGPKTILAVTKLQKDIGVDNSSGPGYFGPQTIAVLSGQNVQSMMDMKDAAGNPITNESATANPISTPGNTPTGETPPGEVTTDNAGNPIDVGTPYHMGQYSLIRFANGLGPNGYTNDQQLWLMDSKTRTIRPFESQQAIENFFGGPIDIKKITPVSPNALIAGGVLGETSTEPAYDILDVEYAIKSDGTAKRLDYSNAELAVRYGKGVDTDSELKASMALDGFLNLVDKNQSGLSPATISSLKSDPSRLAFYINAIAYGGYTLPDIYRDIRKKELGLDDVTPISSTATRERNKITPEGLAAASDTRLYPPPQIGNVSVESLNLALTDLPDEAFKTLIPILDIKSDEFKAQMGTIQDAYNDVLMQQVNATTEQEKAVADYAWEKLRKDINTSYGIQLSSNAIEAGNQIEQAFENFSKRGIQGSGIQNEAIDDYLKNVRRSDQISRMEKLSKEESELANYYNKFGTSKQIADLIAEDQAKGLPREQWRATKWGLVPSDEIKASFSIDALKAKYPNVPIEELQRYAVSMLDENGNYRSGLYQRQINSLQHLQVAKEAEQQTQLLNKSLNLEEEKYREFTSPDSPFLRTSSGTTGGTTGIKPVDTTPYIKLKDTLVDQNYTPPKPPSGSTSGATSGTTFSGSTGSIKTGILNQIKPIKTGGVDSTKTKIDTPTIPKYDGFVGPTQPGPTLQNTGLVGSLYGSPEVLSPYNRPSAPIIPKQTSTWDSVKNAVGSFWDKVTPR